MRAIQPWSELFNKRLISSFLQTVWPAFWERGNIMHLQKISIRVSLRNPRRLTRVDTFCFKFWECPRLIDWLNYWVSEWVSVCVSEWVSGVLRRLQQYFSHITATAYIIHALPGFHQYWADALKCFTQGQSHEKPEYPVRLEPRTPWLQVKHFTTELCRTTENVQGSTTSWFGRWFNKTAIIDP